MDLRLWPRGQRLLRNVVCAVLICCACGCASIESGARESKRFPTASDVAATPEAQRLFRQATIDFNRVRAGQLPIYATFKNAPRFGKKVFTNTGYSIEDSPLLLAGDDRMFHQAGITLTLGPPITTTPMSFREDRLVRRPLVAPGD